jgi:hypothetical protein
VVQKINSIRLAFRKQLKRARDSKRWGASEDDVYEVLLWYLNERILLLFLDLSTAKPNVKLKSHFAFPHLQLAATASTSLGSLRN